MARLKIRTCVIVRMLKIRTCVIYAQDTHLCDSAYAHTVFGNDIFSEYVHIYVSACFMTLYCKTCLYMKSSGCAK